MMQLYETLQEKTSEKIKQKLIDILLMSTSSTTRLLETITGEVMEVEVIYQKIVSKNEINDEALMQFTNSVKYLKRVVTLHSNGCIFSDNIVIAAFDYLTEEIKTGLLEGEIPLGRLIRDKENKRELLWNGYINKEILANNFKKENFTLPEYPAKKYLIYLSDICCFYLLEVFHTEEIVKYFWN